VLYTRLSPEYSIRENENLKEEIHMRDIRGYSTRIIKKLDNLKDVRMRIGFIWLRMFPMTGSCESGKQCLSSAEYFLTI
jgi:hypothetical protein